MHFDAGRKIYSIVSKETGGGGEMQIGPFQAHENACVCVYVCVQLEKS